MLIFLAAIFSIVALNCKNTHTDLHPDFCNLAFASQGLKIEEVITHEIIQNEQEITIEENLHGGKVLVLSDGSTWEIAPQDLNISQTWILPIGLRIEKSTNPSYPYRIINTNSNSSILARPIATNRSGA